MKCKGYTLVEVLIVVAIVGILASIFLSEYSGHPINHEEVKPTIIINEGDLN